MYWSTIVLIVLGGIIVLGFLVMLLSSTKEISRYLKVRNM